MINPKDCTWEQGMIHLRQNYPNGVFTFGISNVTGNNWVKVDGSLALKQERISENGAKLCNEFAQNVSK